MAAVAVGSVSPDPAVSFVVIELDNLWFGLSRSLYLSCAFGARDGTGNPVMLTKAARCRTTDEALAHAIRRFKPKRFQPDPQKPPRTTGWTWFDEPSWGAPSVLITALDEIGASTRVQVSNALSLTPAVFSDLHAFRNFYSHRGLDTRRQLDPILRRYQLPTTYAATVALCSTVPAPQGMRPQELLLDWIDDIWNTVSLLV